MSTSGSGKRRLRTQPVVGFDAEPASAREVVHDRAGLADPSCRGSTRHRGRRSAPDNPAVETRERRDRVGSGCRRRRTGDQRRARRRGGARGTERGSREPGRRVVALRARARDRPLARSSHPEPVRSARSMAGLAARPRRASTRSPSDGRGEKHHRGDAECRIAAHRTRRTGRAATRSAREPRTAPRTEPVRSPIRANPVRVDVVV